MLQFEIHLSNILQGLDWVSVRVVSWSVNEVKDEEPRWNYISFAEISMKVPTLIMAVTFVPRFLLSRHIKLK